MNREELAQEQHAPPPRQDEIIGEVQAIFMEKTRDQWLKILNPNDICYAPVNSLEEALEHPQIRHRGLWFKGKHPEDGEIPQPGFLFGKQLHRSLHEMNEMKSTARLSISRLTVA